IFGLVILLYFQNIRYQNIVHYEFERPHDEVLRNVALMHSTGNDVNWIIAISFILFGLNMLFYRNWINSKRWILEPVLVLIITMTLTLTYHFDRVIELGDKLNTTHNKT